MLKGFTRNFKPLEILTEEQVEAIHRATIDVLRETGIRFESDWALDFFERNGCVVDRDLKRVRFPEGLVEESLRKAPSSYRVKARTPGNDMVFGGNTVYFLASCGMRTVDLDTLEARPPTKSELIDLLKVLDSLPNLHWALSYPYFGFEGVPPVMAILEGDALKCKYYTKLQKEAYYADSEIFTIQMMQATGQEIMGTLSPAPPMAWPDSAVMNARRLVEAGFPVSIIAAGSSGATAPATHAGAVVTGNAEIISMLVLIQLLHPGHRVIPMPGPTPMNMRSGGSAFSDIGASLIQATMNQVWRRYEVPMCAAAGAFPSSKNMDFQTGYEKTFTALIASLSGAHNVILHGAVASELTMHPVQAILDDDIAGMVGRVLQGVEVSPETIALELIHEVGPMPGSYLEKAHTRKWWKNGQYISRAADRLSYPEWKRSGKKAAIDYAKEIMGQILDTHKVDPPLTAAQEQAVENILREAREYYRKRGLISDDEWETYKQVW